MTLRYIIGVDPGESTGLYVLFLDDLEVIRFLVYQGPPGQALDHIEATLAVARELHHDALIACERYTITPETGRRTQQPVPLQVIGQVQHIAEKFNARLVLRSPGDAKAFASNDLLRRLGLLVRSREVGQRDANDVNDAARHALLALATTRASVFDSMLLATESQRR